MLSDEDKNRIREEEKFRASVRKDGESLSTKLEGGVNKVGLVVLAVVLIGLLILIVSVS